MLHHKGKQQLVCLSLLSISTFLKGDPITRLLCCNVVSPFQEEMPTNSASLFPANYIVVSKQNGWSYVRGRPIWVSPNSAAAGCSLRTRTALTWILAITSAFQLCLGEAEGIWWGEFCCYKHSIPKQTLAIRFKKHRYPSTYMFHLGSPCNISNYAN